MKITQLNREYQQIKPLEFSGSDLPFDDCIDFSIGDPDLATDDRITSFAFSRALSGETHYTVSSGKRELKEAIVAMHHRVYGQEFGIENVHVTSSASHAMYLVLKAILNPGDEVVVFAPYFPNYLEAIAMNKGKPHFVYTDYEHSYEIDENELEKAINEDTKAIILNNPCNPSGHFYSLDSYEAVYRVAKRHGLLVICDDIYTAFVYQGKTFVPFATYKDASEFSIQIRSFSKDYLMTGWRLGYIIADKTLIGVTTFLNESIVYSPSIIAQNAAIRGLELFEEITAKSREIYEKRLQKVYECAQKSRYFECLKPEGTFYVFLNISKTGMGSFEFAKYVFEKAHVKLFAGELFGGEKYRDFVRLAVNMDEEKIEESFTRLNSLSYSEKI